MTNEDSKKGFVDSYGIYRKKRPTVTLIVKRDILEPTLIRNSNEDRAETQEFNDRLHAQANGEKFTSKERLTGLALLRELKEKFVEDENGDVELISDEYTYNEPKDFPPCVNLDPLIYGLAGTGKGSDNFSFKSRVVEGYTYSTKEYDIMKKETRNAVYESGTMKDTSMGMDSDGNNDSQSRSLFNYVKVQPGNSFVHFITLEAGTENMLQYVLYNILNTQRYGARETRTGKNVNNKILGVILSNFDATLSTGELIAEYHENEDEDIKESIKEYIEDVKKDHWTIYSSVFKNYQNYPRWLQELLKTAKFEQENSEKKMFDMFKELTDEARGVLGQDDS